MYRNIVAMFITQILTGPSEESEAYICMYVCTIFLAVIILLSFSFLSNLLPTYIDLRGSAIFFTVGYIFRKRNFFFCLKQHSYR